MTENILGTIAGILTSISMLPQLIKVLKENNVEDLSALMLIILIIGLSFWVWYGILKNEWPIIISNGFAVIVDVCLLISLWKYKAKYIR
ncbi:MULTISPECIES: SemiSWEET transporter [Chryseobacterium]|uniref:SemiSWEET transporter n=1 Tax=Chryseobacterium turcicum TaxID=2898076 RepID=A0A9Q3V3T5_9FLAO|nr:MULTISPECIES: SemiSWEET transporter [Chryseobacterium]MCD1119103.1 SemiSWEET transporter [Chryseobacterium turcicum]